MRSCASSPSTASRGSSPGTLPRPALSPNTEARLDAIEGKHDWFSAIAYARLNGLPTNSNYLRKLGACAGQIGRSHGVEPTQVQHQLYGWVNSWPAWVWDLAADGFAR